MANVEDGGDVVGVVVELLATVHLETGGGLDDVARHIGRHYEESVCGEVEFRG